MILCKAYSFSPEFITPNLTYHHQSSRVGIAVLICISLITLRFPNCISSLNHLFIFFIISIYYTLFSQIIVSLWLYFECLWLYRSFDLYMIKFVLLWLLFGASGFLRFIQRNSFTFFSRLYFIFITIIFLNFLFRLQGVIVYWLPILIPLKRKSVVPLPFIKWYLLFLLSLNSNADCSDAKKIYIYIYICFHSLQWSTDIFVHLYYLFFKS